MLPTAPIRRIYIYPLNNTDITTNGVVSINSSELFKGDIPQPGGLYDPRLGPIDFHQTVGCTTCHNARDGCLGHSGYIELNYPIVSPLALKDVKLWLKVICHHCGNPLLTDVQLESIPAARRMNDVAEKTKNSSRQAKFHCPYCRKDHPDIVTDEKESTKLMAKRLGDETYIIHPDMIKTIFNQVTYETVRKFGRLVHPREYVLDFYSVSPVNLRPDTKKSAGGKSSVDPITSKTQALYKEAINIPTGLSNPREKKDIDKIYKVADLAYSLVRSIIDQTPSSFAARIKGKHGRCRKNLLGKRTFNVIRSIIVGNVHIPVDVVIIPLSVAKTVTLEEVYQPYNADRLNQYFLNTRIGQYPAAVRIIKPNGSEYDASKVKNLEFGDIVLRNAIDGDIGNFNRQPSLMASNISGMRMIVNRDTTNKTIMMNPLACPWFNADFDGDAMNIIIHASAGGRNELEQLSAAPNWFISHSSTPAVGLAEDSIVGCALLTKSHIRYDKYHALLLYHGTSFVPKIDIGRDEYITGRDCLSYTLESTPISYERGTEFFQEDKGYTKWIKYRADETKAKVVRGKILAGVIDKKAIGKGSAGGFYHLIAHEYGPKKALEVIYDQQQVAIGHIFQEGLTIGIKDMMIMLGAKDKVDRVSSNIVADSLALADRLRSGDIIAPIGKTVEQFYEEQQINGLKVLDDFHEPIFGQGDPMSNNLFKLIVYGSKGSVENMLNMVSSVGQKLINGERTRQRFGPARTGPYYTRYDLTPEARGYVGNSYLGGINAAEFTHNAGASRFDLITKALTTSVTGDQNRKAIKNLESQIINNFRQTAKQYGVIELAYGGDFLDPRFMETGTFPLVSMSNAAFEAYNKDPTEFATLTTLRDWYRGQFLRIEQMNIKDLAPTAKLLPFNVDRIIKDTMTEMPELLGESQPAALLAKINKICAKLPYILANRRMERAKVKLPPHVMAATKLAVCHLRQFLNLKNCMDLKITPQMLKAIFVKIRRKYSACLIAPGTCVGIIAAQSFSEPLTQYMLDSHRRSAVGGTSKSTMSRVKEILKGSGIGAVDTSQMTLILKPEYADKAQQLANNLEILTLQSLAVSWRVFFEKFGEIEHPAYRQEAQAIAEFVATSRFKPPSDLTRWCLHFSISKTQLAFKNISIEDVVHALRIKYPNIYFVYSQENAFTVFLRCQLTPRELNDINVDRMRQLAAKILDTPLRGVPGIRAAVVGKCLRQKVAEDGSLTRADVPTIVTLGTNIAGVAVLPFVDAPQINTDAIQEVARIFGIEAARTKIAIELRAQVEKCNYRHYMTYANEMTSTGRVTAIEAQGLKAREKKNALLRVGSSHPTQVLEEAILGTVNDIYCVTGKLLVGAIPRIGTTYNNYVLNEEFVAANVKTAEDILGEL